ncbi:MAG: SURF1 family cytochrome oxidase biogenesis protein, partial [Longimicrobiales bacterium]
TSTAFRRTWFAPDPAALRRQFPYTLLNMEVQALPDSSVQGFPIRLQPPVLDRGPHLGYAVQWFSFAAIALIGWVALMIRNREVRR